MPRNAWRVQQAIRESANREVTSASQTGRTQPFAALLTVQGTGQSQQQVWFPDSYLEVPLFTWGAELVGNQNVPEDGAPIFSAAVRRWSIDQAALQHGNTFYVGATVLLVVYGGDPDEAAQSYNRYRFHCRFEGRAVIAPLNVDG